MIAFDPSLKSLLAAATTKKAWAKALMDNLGKTRRLRCFHNGVEFLNIGFTSDMTVSANGDITGFGILSGATIHNAADLSTGSSTLRVEGNGYYLEGSLGLVGSGTDFTFSSNPTIMTGVGFVDTAGLQAPANLPVGSPTAITLSSSSTNVVQAGNITLTATVTGDTPISNVQFFENGSLLGTAFSAPYTYSDAISSSKNGTLNITATVVDTTGQTATASVLVTVNIPVQAGEIPVGSAFTDFTFQNTSGTTALSNTPFTFAHIFKDGEFPSVNAALTASPVGGGTPIPLQVNAKATYPSGTIKHAIISGILPSLAASASQKYNIVRASYTPPAAGIAITTLTSAGLDASISIVDAADGVTYSASMASYLNAGTYTKWLTGDKVDEYLVVAPMVSATNITHPHLHARFYVRAYSGISAARVDPVLEFTYVKPAHNEPANTSAWTSTYTPVNNVTYDATITVGGSTVYTQSAVVQTCFTRWRKTYWWGTPTPTLHTVFNMPYIISSKALPNYDLSIVPRPSSIQVGVTNLANKGGNALLGQGLNSYAAMATVGGRADIGMLPGWNVMDILQQTPDVRYFTTRQGDLGGSWPAHFRDMDTGKPLSTTDWPYASTVGSLADSKNKVTGKYELLACPTTKYDPLTVILGETHHPDFGFLAYLLTGDHYYLEEIGFWATFCNIVVSGVYRGLNLGLQSEHEEIRGAGWAFRTFAHYWYLAPDGDKLKSEMATCLKSNADWIMANCATPGGAYYTTLNACLTGKATIYPDPILASNPSVGISTWQDHYYTEGLCRAYELGFTPVYDAMMWKLQYSVKIMTSGPDYCWQLATVNDMKVRDTATSPFYTTFAQVYAASVPATIQSQVCGTQGMQDAINAWNKTAYPKGTMVVYPGQSFGSPQILQVPLSYAVSFGVPNADNAWLIHQNRSTLPDWSDGPEHAFLPRV